MQSLVAIEQPDLKNTFVCRIDPTEKAHTLKLALKLQRIIIECAFSPAF